MNTMPFKVASDVVTLHGWPTVAVTEYEMFEEMPYYPDDTIRVEGLDGKLVQAFFYDTFWIVFCE